MNDRQDAGAPALEGGDTDKSAKPSSGLADAKLYLLSAVFAGVILAFDLSLPLGVAGGVLYAALVMLGAWATTTRFIFVLASVGTILTVVGYLQSEPGGIPWVVLVNRGLAFFVIWSTAALVAVRKRGRDALKEAHGELERRVLERTAELAESEARFRDFARSSSDWFWETDEEHRFKWVTGRADGLVGGNFEAMEGRTRWEVFDGDPERDPHWRRLLDDMEAHRPFRRFQYYRDDADGDRAYRSVSGTPVFDGDGAFRGYRGTSTDTTAQMQAEQALRESEQRFRDLAEGSIQGIIVYRDFRPLYVNEAFARIFGYTVAEVLELETTLALITPAERSRLEGYDETRSRGEPAPSRLEIEGLRKDGSVVWLDGLIGMVDWDGEPAIQGTVVDITDRKQDEEALRLRDRQLSEAQRIGHIGHWTTNLIDGWIECSDEVCRLFGIEPKPRLPSETIFDAIHEDDRVRAEASRRAALAEKRSYDFAYRIRRADGQIRFVEGRASPVLDDDGGLTGFFGVTQDVTDRKLAEAANERILYAIQHLSEGIALYDADDRLVVCNDQYRRLLGSVANFLQPGLHFEDFLRLLIEHGQVPEKELEAGPEQWLARRLERHHNPTGTFEVQRDDYVFLIREDHLPDGGTVISTLDISEQKQRDEQLRQAQKMEAIGQLTGGVAHDFNNLLAIIQGNIGFLDRKLETESELRALTAPTLRAVKRGASLTQRLLAFSRRQTLDVQAVDPGELLDGLGQMLERSLGEDISLEVTVPPDLWACEVDAGQLEQAIVNLANNARDAMPDGGKLTIEAANAPLTDRRLAARAEVTPGDYVSITVTDSGTGIPVQVRERIFEPFFTTKDVDKGTGLGLSMVYGFVTQSGGHVSVFSEAGLGTTIRLYLPRMTATRAAERPAGDTPGPAAGETILLLEDDPDLRAITRRVLQDFGYRVLEAESGQEALATLGADEAVDLLLTDVVLPGGMSGPETARSARQSNPDLEVVFMSGYAGDNIAQLRDQGEEVTLLQKPFDPDLLGRSLRQALGGT